jgi:hypothetical protein
MLLLGACNSGSIYERHYRLNGTMHPELVSKQYQECRAYGFQDGSKQLSDCQLRLAQDWKRNFEWRPSVNSTSQAGDCGFTVLGFPIICPKSQR